VYVRVSVDVPGVQPVVRPNGQLVLVFLDEPRSLDAVRSNDGGATFGGLETIASMRNFHRQFRPELLRVFPLPTVGVDGAGTLYVAWSDCRFRRGCAGNDIVLSHSTPRGWTAPRRIPTPGASQTADHVLPGLGVDPGTRGARAHLAVTFYSVRAANCAPSACALDARLTTSATRGARWAKPLRLNGRAIPLAWLARTSSGYMVGDYVGTTFAGRVAVAVLALAAAPPGDRLAESMYTMRRTVR
jgi:hypothetical protein